MTTEREDARLKKEFDVVGRREATRHSQDRQVTESRELSEDDRLEMFRNQLFNDALPDLPDLPGYHMCWLTTTNPRDPIYRRMQLGYEPVKAEEMPGMAHATVKTGEYAGMLGVNEMLAFKLPLSLYEKFMQEAHHEAPLREENKLAEVAEMMREQAERAGTTLLEGDGMSEMREYAPRRGIFN
ncbi:MAG: hypothetical protein RLZZ387_2625 [Chloroflexota bacterium]|jgi:hypothetical protein